MQMLIFDRIYNAPNCTHPPLNNKPGITSKTGTVLRIPAARLTTTGTTGSWSCGAETIRNLRHRSDKDERFVVRSVEGESLGTDVQRKRKVVDHISLLKAKGDLSEEQEKDMLDYLYTIQYQIRGIVSISLGRLSDQNPEQYTHAIFMRFQTKEDLTKFYKNSSYERVLEEHVIPYCHGMLNLDYESEVEDDILLIFRKGEEFNYGVELMLLVAFVRSSLNGPAEDAMTSLENLTDEYPSLIVQTTKGANMNMSNTEYTHGVVIRFRSLEAFKMFISSSDYDTLWKSQFEPILQKALSVFFSVDPVGTELM